ncbi:MAG: hypoxanthine phosphoribosyltransferase [Desulfobacca sp.]|nr:hypoxanthine phosphoribosyltransferase [Desulfobacca sp.]
MTPPGTLLPVLLTSDVIQARVAELATAISSDYREQDLTLVGILKGSVIFLADLLRQLTIPVTVDFLAITSYQGSGCQKGAVRLVKDLDEEITGRNLLMVEDIVDTGLTLGYLVRTLAARGPASVRVCTLLDRPQRRIVPLPLAYRGFEISDDFVVGYGLDYQQYYRQLPAIYLFSPD